MANGIKKKKKELDTSFFSSVSALYDCGDVFIFTDQNPTSIP